MCDRSPDQPTLVCPRTAFRLALLMLVLLASASQLAAADLTVPAGGNLQAALDTAQPGDRILLAPGARFVGNFVLPVKSGTGYIIIRSSAPDGILPGTGVRTGPVYAQYLPTIATPNSAPALQAPVYSHHWRIENVRFDSSDVYVYNLVAIGATEGGVQNAAEKIPHDIVLDRVYIDIPDGRELRRGVMLNGNNVQVINSYVVGVKDTQFDCQAIAAWNAYGPFLIENNALEASTENVAFGGANPEITGLVPSDITIRRNHIFKRWEWWEKAASKGRVYCGTLYRIKNLFEFKAGKRVIIEGNLFENNWASAQKGTSILFYVRNDAPPYPVTWQTIEDVVFRHNVVRHISQGILVRSPDDEPGYRSSDRARRVTITNNLFYDLDNSTYYDSRSGGPPGGGTWIEIESGSNDLSFDHGTENLTVTHNTVVHGGGTGYLFLSDVGLTLKVQGATIVDNVMDRTENSYGTGGFVKGGVSEGDSSISAVFEGTVSITKNVMATDDRQVPAKYEGHPGNYFPTVAQFASSFGARNPVVMPNGRAETLPFFVVPGTVLDGYATTDGKKIGCDLDTVRQVMAGGAPANLPGIPGNLRVVK